MTRLAAFGRAAMLAVAAAIAIQAAPPPARAADIPGAQEHPMVTRYPGQEIRWQLIENHMDFKVPLGPVTGYRFIADWAEASGRVTRTFYRRTGTDRSYREIYLNFLEAFEREGFEIRLKGASDNRRGNGPGAGQWLDVYLRTNALTKPGEAGAIAAGTSSSGGMGQFVATKDRAAGRVWVVVTVEQHAEDYVAALIDIVEEKPAETGLVVVDAEAIGRDLTEKGRVVLDGILFEFDSAALRPESDAALQVIAGWLKQNPDAPFFVVGHTDSIGSLDYNLRLSQARAGSVVEALVARYGVRRGRLEAHGVGPLVPVFSNASDAGRNRNRRVELVERREKR